MHISEAAWVPAGLGRPAALNRVHAPAIGAHITVPCPGLRKQGLQCKACHTRPTVSDL